MSDPRAPKRAERQAELAKLLQHAAAGRGISPKAERLLRAAAGDSAHWWAEFAATVAKLMQLGEVAKFHIEITPRGTYEFEIDPVKAPTPHRKFSACAECRWWTGGRSDLRARCSVHGRLTPRLFTCCNYSKAATPGGAA